MSVLEGFRWNALGAVGQNAVRFTRELAAEAAVRAASCGVGGRWRGLITDPAGNFSTTARNYSFYVLSAIKHEPFDRMPFVDRAYEAFVLFCTGITRTIRAALVPRSVRCPHREVA
jgi:hypothetical protein